jgi:hypothetical protein
MLQYDLLSLALVPQQCPHTSKQLHVDEVTRISGYNVRIIRSLEVTTTTTMLTIINNTRNWNMS